MVRIAHTPRLRKPNLGILDELTPLHHSLVDWNFQPGVGFAIASDRYVSPPSALRRPTGTGQGTVGYFNLKPAISGNLLDGRVATYYLFETTTYRTLLCFVRAQTEPYLGYPANCYFFMLASPYLYIYQRLAGVDTILATAGFTPSHVANTWYRFRFTWYTWLDASLNPVLRFEIDFWEGGIWVNKLSYDRANPLWQTAPQNYVGFSLAGAAATTQNWIDDTEVYARFPG